MDNNTQFYKNELGIKCNFCGEAIGLLLGKEFEKGWKLTHECPMIKKQFVKNELGIKCNFCSAGIGKYSTPQRETWWMRKHECP